MEWWQAGVLAVVEGMTEFLPVSSTGHLGMAANLMAVAQTDYVKSFEVVIQLGAILAAAGRYGRRLIRCPEEAKKVGAAFLPTAVLGWAGYRLIKTYLIGNVGIIIPALAAGGAVMIWGDARIRARAGKKKIADLTYREAAGLGVIQALAVIPGVSRAWVTIWGGWLAGLAKREAVEFSFLLAVPTMAAAAGWDLINSGWGFSGSQWLMLGAAFVGSAGCAWLAMGWFLGITEKYGMAGFGWYRIAAAGLFGLAAG